MAQEKSEFLRGMLDMLILKIVALDPSHGTAGVWCAKIPSSGFQRNVTLFHSELLSADLVSVPRHTRPIDSMFLLPTARALAPKRVHPNIDVRPVGVLAFSKLIRMERVRGGRICTIRAPGAAP